jgi:hypothetical protein
MDFGKFRMLIWKSITQQEMILLMSALLKYDIYLSVLNNHQIRHTVLILN